MSVFKCKDVDGSDLSADISDINKLTSKQKGMRNDHISGYLYQIGFKESGSLLRFDSNSIHCVVSKQGYIQMKTSKGSKRKVYIKPNEWDYLRSRYTKGETIFFIVSFLSGHHKGSKALGLGRRNTSTFEAKVDKTHACMLKIVRNEDWWWYDSNNYCSTDVKEDLRPADRRYHLLRISILPFIKTQFNLKESIPINRESITRTKIAGSCSAQLMYAIERFINNYQIDQLGHSIRLQLLYLYKIHRFTKNWSNDDAGWYTTTPAWTLEQFIARLANGIQVSRAEIGPSLKELEDSDLQTRSLRPRGDFVEIRSFRIGKK